MRRRYETIASNYIVGRRGDAALQNLPSVRMAVKDFEQSMFDNQMAIKRAVESACCQVGQYPFVRVLDKNRQGRPRTAIVCEPVRS